MAKDYKRYVVNMIGDNDRSYLDANREAAQDTYNTNWKRLQNQYAQLSENLDKARQKSNIAYGDALANVSGNAYDKLRGTMADINNRGIEGSGLVNRAIQENTQQKGQAINELLSSLGENINTNTSNLAEGNEEYVQGALDASGAFNEALSNINANDLSLQNTYASELASEIINSMANDRTVLQNSYTKKQYEVDKNYDEFEFIKSVLSDTYDGEDNSTDYSSMYKDAKNEKERKEILNTYEETIKEKAATIAGNSKLSYDDAFKLIYQYEANKGNSLYSLIQSDTANKQDLMNSAFYKTVLNNAGSNKSEMVDYMVRNAGMSRYDAESYVSNHINNQAKPFKSASMALNRIFGGDDRAYLKRSENYENSLKTLESLAKYNTNKTNNYVNSLYSLYYR